MCTAAVPRRVASIRLAGQISPSLGNLTFLRNLSLETNRFSGEIPPSLGHLQRLQYLFLSNNTLQGRIPSFTNCSSLRVLWLHWNGLVGLFPKELPPGLRQLQISVNSLSGGIPASLSNITALTVISCVSNNFAGNIPDEFARLSNMQQLYVGWCRLPSTIGRLRRLEMLNLEYNQLQAESKQDWEFLNSLANCTELIDFSVTRNRLRGHVPASLGNLTSQLQYLYMSENQLSGEFPPGIANLGNLLIVSLDVNQFSGALPEWLGSLQNLQKVLLGSNYFSGAIPSSFSNLSQLAELYL